MKLTCEEVHVITHEGENRQYHLFRQRVKNINMRILADGSIVISAPISVPIHNIEQFIIAKWDWIKKAQTRQTQRKEAFSLTSQLLLWGKRYRLSIRPGNKRLEIREDQVILYTPHTELEKECKETLQAELKQLMSKEIAAIRGQYDTLIQDYHCALPSIRYRRMVSKWGCCQYRDGVITMNTALVHFPKECLSYVLLHEYLHLVVPNHSARFHELMAYHMPDYKKVKKLLNEYHVE